MNLNNVELFEKYWVRKHLVVSSECDFYESNKLYFNESKDNFIIALKIYFKNCFVTITDRKKIKSLLLEELKNNKKKNNEIKKYVISMLADIYYQNIIEKIEYDNNYDIYDYNNAIISDEKYSEIIALYKESAELGNTFALINLGKITINNYDKIKYYNKAIELGNTYAISKMGDFYYNSNNFREAKKFYEKAAELGNLYVIKYKIGEYYLYGGCGKLFDNYHNRFVKYYTILANQSKCSYKDCINVVYNYLNRPKSYRNKKKILDWCIKAIEVAKIGDIIVFEFLENNYISGNLPCEFDIIKKYEELIELGNLNAIFALAYIYIKGEITKKNYIKSYELFNQLYDLTEGYMKDDIKFIIESEDFIKNLQKEKILILFNNILFPDLLNFIIYYI